MRIGGDFLVIGSGIAGLRAAISLAERGDVVILTKADPRESNTGYAQGGIAAAVGDDDSPELHAQDTLAAGDGLCVAEAVDVLVHEGPRYVRELLDWGAASIATERDSRRSAVKPRTACGACCTRVTPPAGISARCSWERVAAHPRVHGVAATRAALSLADARTARASAPRFLDRRRPRCTT